MSVATAIVFLCTPVAVYDGDGPVHCSEGEKIRIAGIAAREMDGTCRPGQPCPRSSAAQARDALVNVLGGPRGRWKTGHVVVQYPTMKCQRVGQSYGRVVANCTLADGRDLRRVMLGTGTVLPWYPKGS